MTDTYRTAVNPYATKAEEACAKLQRERTAATELEAQRVALLAEVNAGLAPFEVYRRQGGTFENNTVRLTHPDSGEACYLCNEDSMLEDLPRRLGTAHFAKCVEQLEESVKKRAARGAKLRRAVEPVSLAVVSTVLVSALHYALDGDFEWGRAVFVLVCCLAFNLWYFGTFKRSPP